jgi:hypothetical protein
MNTSRDEPPSAKASSLHWTLLRWCGTRCCARPHRGLQELAGWLVHHRGGLARSPLSRGVCQVSHSAGCAGRDHSRQSEPSGDFFRDRAARLPPAAFPMPDSQQLEADPLEDSPSTRRMSLLDEADAVLAETEAELAQMELQAAAAARAAASGQEHPVVDTKPGEGPTGRATLEEKTLTPLGKQWADGMAADMARRAGAPAPDSASVSVPRPLEVSMFEGADGPEADKAWRSLVAKHPDATVIDDFLIALPSEGGEPEPEMQATAAEPEPEPVAPPGEQTPSREDETTGRSPPPVLPQRKHGLLRRLGLPLVWIAALLWIWQIVRTKRLRPPSGAIAAAAGAP